MAKPREHLCPFVPPPLQWGALEKSHYGNISSFNNSMEQTKFVLQGHPAKQESILEPPPTHLDDDSSFLFQLSDFCITPSDCCNDAKESGKDPLTGQRVALSREQHSTLQQHGHIHVASRRFQDQYHTWQVARCVYSGPNTIAESFLEYGLGAAVNHMIHAFDNASSVLWSLRDGVLNSASMAMRGIHQLIQSNNYRAKYSESTLKLLLQTASDSWCCSSSSDRTATLVIHPASLFLDDERLYNQVWEALIGDGGWDLSMRPSTSARNETRNALEIVHRLRNQEQMRGQSPQQVEDADQTTDMSPRAARDYLRQQQQLRSDERGESWVQALENAKHLEGFQNSLVESYRSEVVQDSLQEEDRDAVLTRTDESLEDIRQRNPILSRSSVWMDKKHSMLSAKFTREQKATYDDRLANKLKESGFETMARMHRQATVFDQEHKEELGIRLQKVKIPLPPAPFRILQFNPKNWRKENSAVQRHLKVEVSLINPFWRLRHTFLVFWSATKNFAGGSYHFLVNGPLSLRALFSRTAFYGIDGQFRDSNSLTQSLSSRLRSFWATLREVKERFEAEPDTGLIGKSITRGFLHLYLASKGVLGTAWIVAFILGGSALALPFAGAVLLLSPVIGFCTALFVVLFNMFVYDTAIAAAWRRPVARNLNRLQVGQARQGATISPFIKIFVMAPATLAWGVARGSFTLVLSIIHPAAAVLRLSFAGVRACFRTLRDKLTWPILRRAARVPATADNTWLAYRTHGPGVASTVYFRLPFAAAKRAVQLLLDAKRLDIHDRLRKRELGENPYTLYTELFDLREYGMKVVPSISNPLILANEAISAIALSEDRLFLHTRSLSRVHQDTVNSWDRLFQSLRSHHPDFFVSMNPRKQMPPPASAEVIDEAIGRAIARLDLEDLQPSPLVRTVSSIVPTLTSWMLKVTYKKSLIARAVSLPPDARGRFRMTKTEINELWSFVIDEIQAYNKTIHHEVEKIADESDWLSHADGQELAGDFLGTAKSTPILAYQVLSGLLGESAVLETIEDLDKSLVLELGIAPEDRHLMFWKGDTRSSVPYPGLAVSNKTSPKAAAYGFEVKV